MDKLPFTLTNCVITIYEGQLKVWAKGSWTLMGTLVLPETTLLGMAMDFRFLYAIGKEKKLYVWDRVHLAQLPTYTIPFTYDVYNLLTDGRLLFLHVDSKGFADVWAFDNDLMAVFKTEQNGAILSVDDRRCYGKIYTSTPGGFNSLATWDKSTGHLIGTLNGDKYSPSRIVNDKNYVYVYARSTGTDLIRVYQKVDMKLSKEFSRPTGDINAIAVDDRFFYFCEELHVIHVLEKETWRELHVIKNRKPEEYFSFRIIVDSDYLYVIAGGKTNCLVVYQIDTWKKVTSFPIAGDEDIPLVVDNAWQYWDPRADRELKPMENPAQKLERITKERDLLRDSLRQKEAEVAELKQHLSAKKTKETL